MPITERYFPSQKQEEKIFLLLRRHWFSYVSFLMIGLIMSVPLFILFGYYLTYSQDLSPALLNISILAASAYLLFIIGLLLYGFIDYYLDVYIVTNERIVNIEQSGFFKRKISELHLHQIQDVNAQVKGLFATLLHYGDIYIQTAGERENFIFKAVPNTYRITKMIADLHEAAIEVDIVAEEKQIIKKAKEKEKGIELNHIKSEPSTPFNLDVAIAKVARKRTKEFLGGAELIETGMGIEIQNELDKQYDNNILEKVEKDKNMNSFNMAQDIKSKSTITTDNEPKNEKKHFDKSGELRENEEIDI